MSRYKRKTKNYYCPQCGNKTLISEMIWQTGSCNYFQKWVCHHNRSSKQLKRSIDNGWIFADENRSKAEVLEFMRKRLADNPPCNCEIEVPGRHAEISDFGTVLDKLARAENHFMDWLLANNHTIHKKGFEIIHQTDFLVLARLRDRGGVGAWIYWEGDRDSSIVLGRENLKHEAANYIKFRGVSLYSMFSDRDRFCLWKKKEDDLPFSGKSIGKRMRSGMIEWASAFEKEFPKLLAEAKLQRERWTKEEVDLKDRIQRISHKIRIRRYNGEEPSCRVDLKGAVTPEQARKIARIVEGRPEGD